MDIPADGKLRVITVDGRAPRDAVRAALVAEIAAAARVAVLAHHLDERDERRREAVALLTGGRSVEAVAKEVGVSPGQVRLWKESL